MRFNVQNAVLSESVEELNHQLDDIETSLKEIIRNSIEVINDKPSAQKELLLVWSLHANHVSNFFFQECERTGKRELYKDIIKYAMFNRR